MVVSIVGLWVDTSLNAKSKIVRLAPLHKKNGEFLIVLPGAVRPDMEL